MNSVYMLSSSYTRSQVCSERTSLRTGETALSFSLGTTILSSRWTEGSAATNTATERHSYCIRFGLNKTRYLTSIKCYYVIEPSPDLSDLQPLIAETLAFYKNERTCQAPSALVDSINAGMLVILQVHVPVPVL